MRTLGYMPTEMELIEISQQISMCLRLVPPPSSPEARAGVAGQPGHRDTCTGRLPEPQVIPQARTLPPKHLIIPYEVGRARIIIPTF